MSGGKSGKQKTEIPGWLEDRAKSFLDRAEGASEIPYMPYMGPDVAAMNPMETQSALNANRAASAFGLGTASNPLGGMPVAEEFGGGWRGYSSFPVYEQALGELQTRAPGAMDQYNQQVVESAPGVESTYYDPDNPDHLAVMEAQGNNQQLRFPPGYEWMQFINDRRGGGFL